LTNTLSVLASSSTVRHSAALRGGQTPRLLFLVPSWPSVLHVLISRTSQHTQPFRVPHMTFHSVLQTHQSKSIEDHGLSSAMLAIRSCTILTTTAAPARVATMISARLASSRVPPALEKATGWSSAPSKMASLSAAPQSVLLPSPRQPLHLLLHLNPSPRLSRRFLEPSTTTLRPCPSHLALAMLVS